MEVAGLPLKPASDRGATAPDGFPPAATSSSVYRCLLGDATLLTAR
jgi:hypothetical protein